MYDPRILLVGAIAALAMVACGGKVVVDLPGTGGSTSTSMKKSTGGAGGVFMSSTAVSDNSATSGGNCVPTCNAAFTDGGTICSPGGLASMNYQALYVCACGMGICADSCKGSLCTATPVDPSCMMCLAGNCAQSLSVCQGS